MPSIKIDVFGVEIEELRGSFKSEATKLERESLPSLPNVNYEALLKHY